MPKAPRSSLKARYIDGPSGWRFLFFALAIACIAGLGFRLYFSPERVKQLATSALDKQVKEGSVAFSAAELQLRRGSIPQFALVLRDVKIAPNPQCRPEASVSIAELTLPFRLFALFAGHVAIGTISAEDMVADLDGLKAKCSGATAGVATSAAPAAAVSQAAVAPTVAPSTSQAAPKPWWRDDQVNSIRDVLDGVEFTRVELQFEQKAKSVFLESFEASMTGAAGRLKASAELHIPKEVTFGEALPPLSIEIDATSLSAQVHVSAELNEGDLEADATFTPGPDAGLLVDAQLAVSDVPLSTMVPLLRKAKIVQDGFQPRFLWLDCGAKIKGPFQGLLSASPLFLEKCSVEGDGAQVSIDSAVRQPNGSWDPMKLRLVKLDIEKALRTMSLKGPTGIASDLGRLTGHVNLTSANDAEFEGALEGAKLVFSRRSVRLEQVIPQIEVSFEFKADRFKGKIGKVILENGDFRGRVGFDFDRRLENGDVAIQVDTLNFDPRVEELLVSGLIGPIAGRGDAKVVESRLSAFESTFSIGETNGTEFRFKTLGVQTGFKEGSVVAIALKAPNFEINRNSNLVKSAQPLFFEHEFSGDWLTLNTLEMDAKIPEGGGIRWSRAKANLENGRIALTSEGAMSRERQLFGWIEVDYPLIKKLRWSLAGTSELPALADSSASLIELRKRLRIDDTVLGLPKKAD